MSHKWLPAVPESTRIDRHCESYTQHWGHGHGHLLSERVDTTTHHANISFQVLWCREHIFSAYECECECVSTSISVSSSRCEPATSTWKLNSHINYLLVSCASLYFFNPSSQSCVVRPCVVMHVQIHDVQPCECAEHGVPVIH